MPVCELFYSIYASGIRTIFPDSYHLLCWWHVSKAWARQVKNKVPDKSDRRGTVYSQLGVLMTGIRSKEDFHVALATFMQECEKKDPVFLAYFKKYWASDDMVRVPTVLLS